MFFLGKKLVLAVVFALLCGSGALAQPALPAQARTNAPPHPPPVKPPVELFRELLAMTPGERNRTLAERSEDSRKRIESKLQEYEAMSPDEREVRLRATELRWYLVPLMNTEPKDRTPSLAQVPPEMRELINARLQAWDKLPEAARRALLDNQTAVAYFADLRSRSTNAQQRALENLAPLGRKNLESGIARWSTLPETERQQLLERFNEFFELTPVEKQKALATLSEPERRQIERTLKTFTRLTPQQRSKCIQGFDQFASMAPEDRQQFLHNAERWKTMTPEQRQAWRELVARLNTPPLPQDFLLPPLPMRNPKAFPRPVPSLTNVVSPRSSGAPGS